MIPYRSYLKTVVLIEVCDIACDSQVGDVIDRSMIFYSNKRPRGLLFEEVLFIIFKSHPSTMRTL